MGRPPQRPRRRSRGNRRRALRVGRELPRSRRQRAGVLRSAAVIGGRGRYRTADRWWVNPSTTVHRVSDGATVLRSRGRQAFVAQRRADASAAPTSAAEAGAAGWVLYWSSLVTA